MPTTIITLPTRGNIDRIEWFTSSRDGSERIRVFSDDDTNRHEPPSITEILEVAGLALTVADGTVEMEVLADLDDGREQSVRITAAQRVIDAIDTWRAGKSLADIRTETAATLPQTERRRAETEPNRDGLVVIEGLR